MTIKPDFVVGLGASAGGLEALERFFDCAPTDSGGAFVVVMHLSRDFNSLLDEILARHTKMPVLQISNGVRLHRDTVYVIQPATSVELKNAEFVVTSRPAVDHGGPAITIDTLFKSIALQWRERGAAVVLSGSGSDGARGLTEVHKAGGFTCAQAPETAKFDSMPLAAISTSAVRAVEAPEQLAQTVVEGLSLPGLGLGRQFIADHDGPMSKILEAVVGVSTLDASKYKHSTFERRVRRRMLDLQVGSLSAYAERVAGDAQEARKLGETLCIGVTEFFRDYDAFKILSQQVIPDIIRRAQIDGRPIRVWTAGCATGEEAYSLAMLFAEGLKDLPQRIDVQIFATDVKRDFLSEAARGEFSAMRLAGVPPNMREQFFKPIDGGDVFQIDQAIRKMIVFAPHDILTDPPFTRLDMISCRNLLIYLSIEAQQKILNGFAFGLLEKGYLFLGSSETVGGHREIFEYVDARNRVFKRTASRKSSLMWRAPGDRGPAEVASGIGTPRRTTKIREVSLQPAYAAMLKDYAPASLLLSSERELLHSFGDARRFLRPPEGIAHLDAANMVDPALKPPIIAGLERALREKKAITFSRIQLAEFPEKGMLVDLTIKPLVSDDSSVVHHAIAIINHTRYEDRSSVDSISVISTEALANTRIQELESELGRTRESLQSTIEEMETTNEELQATNEELMSSNEELQSTNEELSSVNEELYTVNSEYHKQNLELIKLGGDFEVLLKSTEVGVVFLDNDLKITRFTALAGDLFKLTESDIGRPISTFRSPLKNVEPDQILAEAIRDNTVVERESIDLTNEAWLVRAVSNPHRLGAVLTVINIARLRNAERTARRATIMLEAIRQDTRAFYIETDNDFAMVNDQLGFADFVGGERGSASRQLDWAMVDPADVDPLRAAIAAAATTSHFDIIVRIFAVRYNDYRYVHLAGSRLNADTWQVIGFDVDEIVRSARDSQESAAVFDALLKATSYLVSFVGADGRYRYVNDAYLRHLKTSREAIIGRTIHEYLPESASVDARPHIEAALRGERQEYMIEIDCADGATQHLSVVYQPVKNETGEVLGFVVDKLDVTKFYTQADTFNLADRLIARGVRQSGDATFLVDIATATVEFANRRAMARIGLPESGPVPPGTRISRLTPEWGDKRWVSWLQSIQPGTSVLEHEIIVFEASSKTTAADISVSVISDASGAKALVRVVDNTERIEVLRDLRERSRQLAISNRDLEQFASVVAHDLRAPLRHIAMFSELLEADVETMEIGSAKEHVRVIHGSAKTMSDMVAGLLEYVRIGRGGREFRSVDIGAIVEKAKLLLAGNIREAAATIEVSGVTDVFADPDLLLRVFQNLLDNAIKYHRPGVAPRIRIEGSLGENSARITFTDNGIGIKPQYAERVFKLFHRLHTDDKYPGLGVGLATCRRIVELHHGTIDLDQTYSAGARFVVDLPIRGRDSSVQADHAAMD